MPHEPRPDTHPSAMTHGRTNPPAEPFLQDMPKGACVDPGF